MDINEILEKCDHTLLAPTATWEDIRVLCDEGMANACASVCIPPSYVRAAAEYIRSKSSYMPVCTVVGFPHGYNTTKIKVLETEEAILDGATEIDMMINLGWVKEKQFDLIQEEIGAVKKACRGRILKVMIETGYLTDPEKIQLCKVITRVGADFVKTSTGFGPGGATAQDIALLKSNVGKGVQVKASGGIQSLEDSDLYLKLGATRLGTSKMVKIFSEMKEQAERNKK